MNKYNYIFVIQGNFAGYFEDLETTSDAKEARYLLNKCKLAYGTNGIIKLIQRRELVPQTI